MRSFCSRAGLCCAGLVAWCAQASAQLAACRDIADDGARLACYDALARRQRDARAEPRPQEPELAGTAPIASALEERWELRRDLKKGAFNLRPYRAVYGLVHATSDPNERPSSPTRSFDSSRVVNLDYVEGKMQFSFKTKLGESLFGSAADLWFGYTQRSYWQAANRRYSSPFRETNYEPELVLVYPLTLDFGALRTRFVGLSLNHQSNGRGESLSRSWNRLIGEAAAEYGPWAFHVRPWARVLESPGDRNDNPDIEDYVGRGEIAIVRRVGGHVVTFTGRHTLRSGSRSRGSAQLDWAIPVVGSLNAHLQAFTGYGESLIDYNHRQTTLGIGFSFLD